MASIMTPSTDPVKRPTVRLGDKDYELKFRLSDLAHLNKDHSIDLAVRAEVQGFAALERLAIIISAGISHVVAMTPEEVMEHIEVPEIPVYTLAVVEAQKKVSPASAQALKALEAMSPKAPKDKTVQ